MSKLTVRLDTLLYPDYRENWDDLLFRRRILSILASNHHLLDVGAGAGVVSEMNFKGIVARVCGVDPDPRVVDNPFLDDAKIGSGECIEYPDDSFDIVIADNVLEHLDDPKETFTEIHRVLKPGGSFFFKTPNRYHYMPLVAMWTPTWFHKWFNRARGREPEDTFHTRYRANCKGQISRLANDTGFTLQSLDRIEGRPEYLRFSSVTYVLGWIYERIVNSSSAFECFRVVVIGELVKAPKL